MKMVFYVLLFISLSFRNYFWTKGQHTLVADDMQQASHSIVWCELKNRQHDDVGPFQPSSNGLMSVYQLWLF